LLLCRARKSWQNQVDGKISARSSQGTAKCFSQWVMKEPPRRRPGLPKSRLPSPMLPKLPMNTTRGSQLRFPVSSIPISCCPGRRAAKGRTASAVNGLAVDSPAKGGGGLLKLSFPSAEWARQQLGGLGRFWRGFAQSGSPKRSLCIKSCIFADGSALIGSGRGLVSPCGLLRSRHCLALSLRASSSSRDIRRMSVIFRMYQPSSRRPNSA
jgi:hypothetical protein